MSWVQAAECNTNDGALHHLFFGQHTAAAAKRICAVCNVQEECLATAMAERWEYGVAGGMDAAERRRYRRRLTYQRTQPVPVPDP